MPRENPRRRTRRSPPGRKPIRVCFATGTRAEFGLMVSTLRAIQAHPALRLQLLVTGMHLDRRHGRSIDDIRKTGWTIDAVVPWPAASAPDSLARSTGRAVASMADAFASLQTDAVLVVGDRVEAFAAATAAHLGGRVVAHVHGGDRALGQVDDALRHAITKLAHLHFPATAQSAARLLKMGEDKWRIHRVGSPGIDGVRSAAAPWTELRRRLPLPRRRYALLVLHPVDADEHLECHRAAGVHQAIRKAGVESILIIHPNNDPGAAGIARQWDQLAGAREVDLQKTSASDNPTASSKQPAAYVCRNAPRPLFLGLMRDAAMLVGNSSSGIIEAASFGTPVIDIGPRQQGREHGDNVIHVDDDPAHIAKVVRKIWNQGHPRRAGGANIYGSGRTGEKIADHLARRSLDPRLKRKLIAY